MSHNKLVFSLNTTDMGKAMTEMEDAINGAEGYFSDEIIQPIDKVVGKWRNYLMENCVTAQIRIIELEMEVESLKSEIEATDAAASGGDY